MNDGHSFKRKKMAIIVDKVKKRQQIALACKDLIANEGIKNLTISKITQTAHIAKGSFYDYFESKEDLVFELTLQLMNEYNQSIEQKLKGAFTIKEKLFIFASFFYDKKYSLLRKIYNEFIAIALTTPNQKMIEFQSSCFTLYQEWISEILSSIPNNKAIASYLISALKGIYISAIALNKENRLKDELENFITLFLQKVIQ